MITLPSEKELIELLNKECEAFCHKEGITPFLFHYRLVYHITSQVIQEVVKVNYPHLFNLNQKHHDNPEPK